MTAIGQKQSFEVARPGPTRWKRIYPYLTSQASKVTMTDSFNSNRKPTEIAYLQIIGWLLFGLLMYLEDQLDRALNL